MAVALELEHQGRCVGHDHQAALFEHQLEPAIAADRFHNIDTHVIRQRVF